MNKGFIFSLSALFGAALIILLSGIAISQLDFASASNPRMPLGLDANDQNMVDWYFTLAPSNPGYEALAFAEIAGQKAAGMELEGLAGFLQILRPAN